VSGPAPKRALILAGGGLKVAFQAGVLQVWLDEAGIEFDIADGASGGVFNLAMWCTGKTGMQIADAWRRTRPLDFFAINPRPWVALSSLDRFRERVLPSWEVDWNRIVREQATFNAFNFTEQKLVTRCPSEMNDDWLLACVSLPTWFPPVRIGNDLYVDSVYATDSNLEAAIANGADELWVIWTVSTRGKWRNGLFDHYFQTIEMAANWRVKDLKRRIKESNALVDAGGRGEFDRHIDLKILRAEVPLHYLFVFNADTLREAVERGVEHARAWCRAREIALRDPAPVPPDPTRLRFSETMRGAVAFGTSDHGRPEGLAVNLTVEVGGLNRFLADPHHSAQLTGWVTSDALGGKLPIKNGLFNLFVDDGDPYHRKMLYRVHFRDQAGHPLTLSGTKIVPRGLGFHPWRDTTTLVTKLFQGDVGPQREDDAVPVAAGNLRLTPLGLSRQLISFRASGPGPVTTVAGGRLVARFFMFFVGTLARLYLRR
jgi:predicted acylesterase/phospholipase RssA